MAGHSRRADEEPVGDRAVDLASGEQAQDLGFALGQAVRGGGQPLGPDAGRSGQRDLKGKGLGRRFLQRQIPTGLCRRCELIGAERVAQRGQDRLEVGELGLGLGQGDLVPDGRRRPPSSRAAGAV